jgi:hypothetical protein
MLDPVDLVLDGWRSGASAASSPSRWSWLRSLLASQAITLSVCEAAHMVLGRMPSCYTHVYASGYLTWRRAGEMTDEPLRARGKQDGRRDRDDRAKGE